MRSCRRKQHWQSPHHRPSPPYERTNRNHPSRRHEVDSPGTSDQRDCVSLNESRRRGSRPPPARRRARHVGRRARPGAASDVMGRYEARSRHRHEDTDGPHRITHQIVRHNCSLVRSRRRVPSEIRPIPRHRALRPVIIARRHRWPDSGEPPPNQKPLEGTVWSFFVKSGRLGTEWGIVGILIRAILIGGIGVGSATTARQVASAEDDPSQVHSSQARAKTLHRNRSESLRPPRCPGANVNDYLPATPAPT